MTIINQSRHYTYEDQVFLDHVAPYKENYVIVRIPDAKLRKIKEFVQELIHAKPQEDQYKKDPNKLTKRYTNGLMGEAALEELLGVHNIIDWTIGDSQYYNVPDLRGIGVNTGVKTSECFNFPAIKKENYYSQIINLKMKDNIVYICGLAMPSTLNRYQAEKYIKDKNMLENNKTGFWGFSQLHSLKDVSSKSDLNKLIAYLTFLEKQAKKGNFIK